MLACVRVSVDAKTKAVRGVTCLEAPKLLLQVGQASTGLTLQDIFAELAMPRRTRSQAVKKARKQLHSTDSPHLGAALVHLTHAAPSFLASLSPGALKNLSATSREFAQAGSGFSDKHQWGWSISLSPSGRPAAALAPSP